MDPSTVNIFKQNYYYNNWTILCLNKQNNLVISVSQDTLDIHGNVIQ